LISALLSYIVEKLTWNFIYTNCKEKNDDVLRREKTKKACHSLYKGLYFIGITITGYYLLKDENFIPPEMFGHGSLKNMSSSFPGFFKSFPFGVRYYYLGTLGYHVHQLIFHLT